MQHNVIFEKDKESLFKRVKKALFALLRLKLCLVLFRVRLLSNFKNDQNIERLRLNLCILNLLPTVKEDVLTFYLYTEKGFKKR